ncbi:hypothetical protein [Candidatus Neoehrlichia procyonis]|uniref:Uncharacterized protein n=1 Tax=Candidatus Neoehrlichia procyonis str. RAC413 TaxID=1359163 RepID=A0A0F3NP08_9RICK|nr:hypothetical protein [Candidatus Neoehrlichia lotoris]KJV69437.1 hypothetical protein NLO413_0829 [Candidatus Neoehrlichia lotoris str. RAC413]
MIKTIIVTKKQIDLLFTDLNTIEHFIKTFTVLDKHKAAKALFSHAVTINYDNNKATLSTTQQFSYSEVNHMVNYMLNHGFRINADLLAETLKKACNLDTHNFFICNYSNNPQFSINIYNNTIIMHPISKNYLDLLSQENKSLINLLESDDTTCDVTVNNTTRSIDIVILKNVYKTIEHFVDILLKANIIEQSDKDDVLPTLINLAFRDFTTHELKIVKNIAQYPNDHSLSKYKNIAKNAETIFSHLANDQHLDSQSLNQLKNALNNRGDFSTAPCIIMQSFKKLDKNFHKKVQYILSKSTHN